MYIDFYGYSPYSGAIYECFEANVNANIKCNYGYAYFSNKEKICTRINY